MGLESSHGRCMAGNRGSGYAEWPFRKRTGVPPISTRQLIDDWRLLLFGFWLMFWSSPGQTYLISLYGGAIREDLALSHGGFGGLYSLGTLASAGVMVWSGRLVDWLDLRLLSLALVVFLALACFSISLAAGAVSLALAFFLLRQSGQGLMSHVSMTAMSRYFEGARGRATAFAAVGFASAEACLPAITIALIGWLGWREAWRVTGLAALVLLVPSIVWLLRGHAGRHRRHLEILSTAQNAPDDPARPRQRQWTRGEVLRDMRFYLVVPAILAPSFFFTGFFFHQVHLVETKGWALDWWGASFALYAGASLLATLVTGPLGDRLGATRLLPFFPAPLGLGLLVLSQSSLPLAGLAFLTLTGITSGWTVTVMGPFWAEVYGVLHLGAVKALGAALSVFSSALSPFLLGWLIDAGASMDGLAMGSAVYIGLACALASLAFRHPAHG